MPSFFALLAVSALARATPPENPLPMALPRQSASRCAGNDLFAAIIRKDAACLQRSLAHMDVNDRDAEGNPALHFAILRKDALAIRLLLRAGADLAQRDFAGHTPRELADLLGHRRLARYLLESERETERLRDAVDRNDIVAASDSLQRGASIGTRDIRLDTFLHKAAQSNFPEIGKLLILHGLKLEARNYLGETPLHCAALRDHADFMTMLLEAGANPSAVDERRRTPLDLAEQRADPQILKLLRKAHARHGSPASVEFDFTGTEAAAGGFENGGRQ